MDYPEIAEGIFPRHRFMSAYEQKVVQCTLYYISSPKATAAFNHHISLGSSPALFVSFLAASIVAPKKYEQTIRWSLLIESGNISSLLRSRMRPLLSRSDFPTFSLYACQIPTGGLKRGGQV